MNENLFPLQNRILFGSGSHIVCPYHRENGRSAGQKLGGWGVAWRNSFLSRRNAIRRYVRSDGVSAHFYDSCFWRRMQGRHRLGHPSNDTSGLVWHVFR